MGLVQADASNLMRQAPMTADLYMGEAIRSIDKSFGDGYAAEHPELVGAFIQASALDFGASLIAKAIGELTDVVQEKSFHDG